MKIKVDKKEYELLLERVKRLEDKVQEEDFDLYENWKFTRETLYDMMKSYFETQCITAIVKRDKEQIVGEVRKQALDNLFKESK